MGRWTWFVLFASTMGCGLVLGVGDYRNCQNDECGDAGDASADVIALDTADDAPLTTCTTSDDCANAANAARVCSAGTCRKIVALGQGSSTFSCVIISDGTVRCWGDNGVGQLGGGKNDYADHPTPVTVMNDSNVPLSDVAEIGMGWDFGCARTNGGKVYCWGSNESGHLGVGLQVGSTSPQALPVSFGARTAKQLSVGQSEACVLMTDSTVFCWGDASQGQIGDPAPSGDAGLAPHDTPNQLPAPTDVNAVQTGERQTCVRTASAPGSLTCWGNGWLGVLDNGDPQETDQNAYPPPYNFEKNTFSVTTSGIPIDSFRFGEEDICALVSSSMYCWGGDYFHMATGVGGQGAPQAARQTTPYMLHSLPPVTEIDPSWRASCAVAAGKAYCWGFIGNGEIGIGPWGPNPNLVGVKPVLNLSSIGNALGVGMHVLTACAWMDDGHVYCWGQSGALGSKLGDGHKTDRDQPDPSSPVKFQ